MKTSESWKIVTIGDANISLDQILDIAKGLAQAEISAEPLFRARMEKSREILKKNFDNGIPIYGVNTGFGKSCGNRVPVDIALQNGENLIRFHGCGTGDPFRIEEVRASIVCRMICLSKGYSGVSVNLLNQMALFLNNGITPVVPCEGSVGASGDLTPMSYIAACLAGEREVFYRGERMQASAALKNAGIPPYKFELKEHLSMLNGTSVMTGIAICVIDRARKIFDTAICSTALSIHALKGNSHHFHPTINEVKPHPGQIYTAKILRDLLFTRAGSARVEADTPDTLQDPYSLRCAPQILGVLYDSLEWISKWIEIEANSSNDNPIFEPESGEVLMGGNFYGGHVSLAMDSLKSALASAADMADRQMAILVDPHLNRGLPADLVRVEGDDRLSHHGFKAMSISTSALTAEALKGTMPAASFSRSTESHNQDKVSLGTIAARDAARICTLVERVISIQLLAAAQACEIRNTVSYRPGLAQIIVNIREIAEPTINDRPMDSDIENIVNAIRTNKIYKAR
jgi:histidine ammonia-lyase